MTPAPALPGMETSAEERAEWRARARGYFQPGFQFEDRLLDIESRMMRDFDRLLAERDRAFAAGREAERAEIVAHLRNEADAHGELAVEFVKKDIDLARSHKSISHTSYSNADAIEAGNHIPDAGNMVGQPSPDTGAR